MRVIQQHVDNCCRGHQCYPMVRALGCPHWLSPRAARMPIHMHEHRLAGRQPHFGTYMYPYLFCSPSILRYSPRLFPLPMPLALTHPLPSLGTNYTAFLCAGDAPLGSSSTPCGRNIAYYINVRVMVENRKMPLSGSKDYMMH